MNPCHVALLCAGLCLWAPPVQASPGDGLGFGPVLGLTLDDDLWLGWEVSGTRSSPVTKASVGGSYRLASSKHGPIAAHYIAWEPWIIVGGTLGFGLEDVTPGPVYGLWEGIPIPFDDETLTGGHAGWMLTVAIGWRGAVFTHQFYLTTKLWHYEGQDFHS